MFNEKVFSLLTKHGKEKVIAPLLEQKLGVGLKHTDAFDTDKLGTFTGEVERSMTPQQTAIEKAKLASRLTGNRVGLGSEGSFFINPAGIGTMNEEMLALVVSDEDIVVVGRYLSPVDIRQAECHTVSELLTFVKQTPVNQGLVLKSNDRIAKGLHGEAAIYATLEGWFGTDRFEDVIVSYDLRAHESPVRQQHIARATENLIEKLQSPCPECDCPGFWQERTVSGLPCELCTAPTHVASARVAECTRCHYQQTFPVAATAADPRFCNFCNP